MLLVGFEDLTEENLTNVFQEHFDSKALSVGVKEDAREFTGVNDQFQSEIRKLLLKVKRDKDKEEEEVSVVVKTTPRTAFQRAIQRIARPFLSEVMWYSQAQTWKKHELSQKSFFLHMYRQFLNNLLT